MQDLKAFPSVARWIENVNRYYNLADEEWEKRLAVLGEFCEKMGKDPEAIIREATEEKGAKVEFMRQLNRLSRDAEGDPRAAHDWNNVVRSFFIHNGARVVVKPYGES